MIRGAAQLGVAVLATLAGVAASAQPGLRELPPLMRTVSDEVGVLSVDEGLHLSRALEEILDEDGIRVVLVIAETIEPESMHEYAGRLARRWAADRAVDPARAIFIVVAVNERKLGLVPGPLLEPKPALIQPDVVRDLAPLLREQRYYEALMTLAQRVHKVVHRHAR